MTCLALAAAGTLSVRATDDLTTYHESGNERAGRYLVNLGRVNGNTARSQTATDGVFDFPKYAGNNDPWYMINDGDTANGHPCTFLHSDPSPNEEYFGYKFKAPATVESLTLHDYSFGDGGLFTNEQPFVQVLTGSRSGTWTTVAAIWSPAYDNVNANGQSTSYTITLGTPATNVWGVRIYGGAAPMADPSGFVACRELRVNGTAFAGVELGDNLARQGTPTPIMSHSQHGTQQELIDDSLQIDSIDTTWESTTPAGAAHWVGVMWQSPRENVCAVGWAFRIFGDGGYFDKNTLVVEYATISGGTTNWTAVSGLDTSVYDATIDQLVANRGSADLDAAFLLAFDEVDGISGLRLRGDGGGSGGGNGFTSAIEFEVFDNTPAPVYTHDMDISAGYVQRLPSLPYVLNSTNPAVEGWPAVGSTVTWQANVKNWYTGEYHAVYFWLLDGALVASGSVTLAGSTYTAVDYDWTWTFNRHELEFVIDPYNAIQEFSERNNRILTYTDAIAAGLWVEQTTYDYFHAHQYKLGDGANGWEDWAQRQARRWNEMLAQAVYGTDAPSGVLHRVRMDQIHVVPDGALPLSGGLPGNNPDMTNRTVDLMWGYEDLTTNLLFSDVTSTTDSNPFFYEAALFHELGHARYLIDTYGFNLHDTDPAGSNPYSNVLVRVDGQLITGTRYLPLLPDYYDMVKNAIRFGENGYGLMGGPYTLIDHYSTMAFNLITRYRAVNGNYNAPTNIGVFINDMPGENLVTVCDGFGVPLPFATVYVYRATSKAGDWYGKMYDDVADQTNIANAAGGVALGRNPFTTGKIVHTYGLANGVILCRVEQGGQKGFACMDAMQYNMEYWRGHTATGQYTLIVPMQADAFGIAGVRPPPGFATPRSTIAPLEVIVRGTSGATAVSAGGVNLSYHHGQWYGTLPLTLGTNIVPVIATATGGIKVTQNVVYVRLDTVPPVGGVDALVQPSPAQIVTPHLGTQITWLTSRLYDNSTLAVTIRALDIVQRGTDTLVQNVANSISNSGTCPWTPNGSVPSMQPLAVRMILEDVAGNISTQQFDGDEFYMTPEPGMITGVALAGVAQWARRR